MVMINFFSSENKTMINSRVSDKVRVSTPEVNMAYNLEEDE